MQNDIDAIYSKLVTLETEIQNLRQGYMLVNQRYTKAIYSLNSLTTSALDTTKWAAIAAEKALFAAKKSAAAASVAATNDMIAAAEAAADAAAATKRAADAAAEAVRISNQAAEAARNARKKNGNKS